MMRAAGARVYYGFDLFEDGSKELDKLEFNAKPRQTLEAVSNRLMGKIHFELFKGNSKETLPLFLSEFGQNSVDFAYIDGGHSVETIQSDWDHVKEIIKPDGMVIFDDYYIDRDTSEVGCNQIVEKLSHDILPIADPVIGGGKVQLVLVRNMK